MFSPILIEYFFFIIFSWVILGLRESFSQSTTYRLKTFFRIDHRVQSSRASQNYMAICNHELTKFTYCNQLLDFNEGRPNYCNRQPCSCTYKLNLNFMSKVRSATFLFLFCKSPFKSSIYHIIPELNKIMENTGSIEVFTFPISSILLTTDNVPSDITR